MAPKMNPSRVVTVRRQEHRRRPNRETDVWQKLWILTIVNREQQLPGIRNKRLNFVDYWLRLICTWSNDMVAVTKCNSSTEPKRLQDEPDLL